LHGCNIAWETILSHNTQAVDDAGERMKEMMMAPGTLSMVMNMHCIIFLLQFGLCENGKETCCIKAMNSSITLSTTLHFYVDACCNARG
jgi:hypothetical protein